MGVPKFYRWVSERYPCLSEVVKEFQIPEFDNLYLDMNGIIHVCSHPEDDNPHFRITEEKIFADIMYYLEFLFRMIKPRKVFFMAVDGVAPRAKMNQQRGRRFRSAREAEELERRAMEKGETLPTEKRFDSNCITPGTPFMVKLQEQLKYFVVKKLSQDPLWQGVRVYLSGHETPGEGEHKIMDFIRTERSSANYDPDTRHCLYGLDADLMMLGLASHEPHFSLLREEVRFGGKRDKNKRPATPEETTFHLLHLSLFREYLDFEYSELKQKLTTFEYDLESVIDDWVLMGFLVGNDFIPHLPNLHINHDALPLLWRTYIEVLPSCGGYINEGGHLNLERFEKYLTALSKFDFDTFSEQIGDLKWLEAKKAGASAGKAEVMSAARKLAKNQKKNVMNQFALLDQLDTSDAEDEELGTELLPAPGDSQSEEESSDEGTLDDEFRHHKRHYYMTKMEYERVTPEVLRDQAEGYVRGIQWILLYYYEGVPSWSWFYPHHYAPYMSDVKDFKNMVIRFDKGTPFLPFEQLMAVLPAASKDFLPIPYQNLMISDLSPVKDFYPVNFDTDLNGKQQDWEAVVLIPFIDEARLLTALRSVQSQLTKEEKGRNSHGPHLLYTWHEEPGQPYPSSLPNHFPDIAINHARLTKVEKHAFQLDGSLLRKGLLPGVHLDVFFPGFPTLKHIPHRAELSKEGVKVFQMNSRGYNVMLHIRQSDVPPSTEEIAGEYLGKEIFVAWPHMYEARVVEVCDDTLSFSLIAGNGKNPVPKINKTRCDENTSKIWYKEVETIADRYKNRLGIDVGDTDILIRALPMTGRKYIFASHGRVTMEKQFGTRPVPYVLQATVKDLAVHEPGFCQYKTLQEYLAVGSAVYMLGWPHYGSQGEVLDTDLQTGRVRVMLSILEEPDLMQIVDNIQDYSVQYNPSYVVAQKLGISGHLLSRLTGTIFMYAGDAELARQQTKPHRVNIALNLKFTKNQMEVPGFTKLVDGQWAYSMALVDVIREYIDKFPEVIAAISKADGRSNDNNYYESEAIPKHCDYTLKDIEAYIKGLPCSGVKPVKSGSDIISEGVIEALIRHTDAVVEKNKKVQKRVKMQVKPHLLYRPIVSSGSLFPDSGTEYHLFDRVVNTRQGFPVPFGLRGTLVGIHPAEVEVNTVYEVIFDEDFAGGISIRSSPNRGYRMPPSALLNLSHGQRKNGAAKPIDLSKAKSLAGRGSAGQQAGGHGRGSGGYAPGQGPPGQQQQHQYGLYQRQPPGNQGYNDNRQGGNTNAWNRNPPYPHGQQQQQQQQQQYQAREQQHQQPQGGKYEKQQGRPNSGVFNGAGNGREPKFVTPRMTQQGTGSARNRTSGEPTGASYKGSGATNTEFENTWKQLQSSFQQPPPPTSIASSQGQQGTSLTLLQAAASLPRVPSPTSPGRADKGSTDSQNTSNNAIMDTSTKIDVQSLFSQAGSAIQNMQDQGSSGKTDQSKPSTTASTKSYEPKVVSNREFAMMISSLEELDVSDDDSKTQSKEEESSAALKKMLNIANSPPESKEKAAPATEAKADTSEAQTSNRGGYGRQVSVQELFEGAAMTSQFQHEDQTKPSTDKPFTAQHATTSHLPSQPASQSSQYEGKGRGQGNNRQKGHQGVTGQGYPHGNQAQGQKGNPNNRPALLIPPSRGGNRNPVMELMSFCQSLQMGLPMYDYYEKSGGHFCVVSLFSGPRVQGSVSKTREEAAESAASAALLQLRGSMQQMAAAGVMAMQQGYRAPNRGQQGARPQHHQQQHHQQQQQQQQGHFSSPNSAFSPVTNIPGFFPPPVYQGGRGRGFPQHYGPPQGVPMNSGGGYGGMGAQRPGYAPPTQPVPGAAQHAYGAGKHSPRVSSHGNQGMQGYPSQQQTQLMAPSANNKSGEDKHGDRAVGEAQTSMGTPMAGSTTLAGNQKPAGKESKTCVVNPFIPLQVARKQTPQKVRKESVSDESPLKVDSHKSPRRDDADKSPRSQGSVPAQSDSNSEHKVVQSGHSVTENHKKQSHLAVHSKSGETSKSSNVTSEESINGASKATPPRQKSTPPKTAPQGSGKKPRRRIAAKFDM